MAQVSPPYVGPHAPSGNGRPEGVEEAEIPAEPLLAGSAVPVGGDEDETLEMLSQSPNSD